MLKTLRLVTLAAAAILVLPAIAGPSWPPTPPAKATGKPAPAVVKVQKAPEKSVINGFEYVGGDAAWQLAQHKYDFVNGRLAMSNECDHAIRMAAVATPSEIEATRRLSPGP